MTGIIITIGDELLIGQVINTNAAFIAERLNSVGVDIARMVTVGDDINEILRCFEEAFSRFDVMIVTGGLGPTHDDITRNAICRFFRTELVSDEGARENIRRFLSSRNHAWSEAAENQTLIPKIARAILNASGTAPGELIERDGKVVIVMPGVPNEMEGIMNAFVVPYFRSKEQRAHIIHRTIKTTGIAESVLAGRFSDLEFFLGSDRLAFLPSPTGVRLRITVTRPDREGAEARVKEIEEYIRSRADKYIYGTEGDELEEVLGHLLADRHLTIAVAESCTGGMIAHRLTNVSGSSSYFERGIVAYSNASKIELLSVSPELISMHGAVCKEVAEAMASGVRERARTDIGLSTTGIAGPTGGSAEKPIGLVWIGYSDKESTFAIKFNLGDNRFRIKERAAQAAMELVRRRILRIE